MRMGEGTEEDNTGEEWDNDIDSGEEAGSGPDNKTSDRERDEVLNEVIVRFRGRVKCGAEKDESEGNKTCEIAWGFRNREEEKADKKGEFEGFKERGARGYLIETYIHQNSIIIYFFIS